MSPAPAVLPDVVLRIWHRIPGAGFLCGLVGELG
jgi:hypothetical protein